MHVKLFHIACFCNTGVSNAMSVEVDSERRGRSSLSRGLICDRLVNLYNPNYFGLNGSGTLGSWPVVFVF